MLDIKTAISFEEIRDQLVINWDQTGIHYVAIRSRTINKEGSKRVEIVVCNDKRQITSVFAGCFCEEMLPPQLIYKGTT